MDWKLQTEQEKELLEIISGYILFMTTFYSLLLLLFLLNMADAENKNHSGDLPVLQPLPPTHFVSEKTCSSQKKEEQPDLQTCLSKLSAFCGYTYVQVWESD